MQYENCDDCARKIYEIINSRELKIYWHFVDLIYE